MNKFDLKPGESLIVLERHVSVFSKKDEMYRYYCLNGNYIGSFTKEQIRSNPDENCIFGGDRIWMKKDDSWIVLNYKARVISENPIKDVKVSENRRYVLLILNDYETEVWTMAGKRLLECFNNEVSIRENYAIVKPSKGTELYELEKLGDGKPYNAISVSDDFSFEEFMSAHAEQKKEKEPEESPYVTTLFNNVQIGTKQVLWLREKYFAICKKSENIGEKACYGNLVAKCYTLDGKFFANTSVIYDNGHITGFKCIETENILALSGNAENWLSIKKKVWRLYNYAGKKISVSLFDWVFVDKTNSYLIGGVFRRMGTVPSLICIFSTKEGEQLSEWYGFKDVPAIGMGYCVMKDFNRCNWVYTEDGNQVFTEPISDPVLFMDNLIIKKYDDGYDVYDCLSGEVFLVEADDVEIELKKCSQKLILFTLDGKKGAYGYSIDKGFYEIVPMKYEKVDANGSLICGQNFLEDATEDIYGLDGKIISSTSK